MKNDQRPPAPAAPGTPKPATPPRPARTTQRGMAVAVPKPTPPVRKP